MKQGPDEALKSDIQFDNNFRGGSETRVGSLTCKSFQIRHSDLPQGWIIFPIRNPISF